MMLVASRDYMRQTVVGVVPVRVLVAQCFESLENTGTETCSELLERFLEEADLSRRVVRGVAW